MDIFNEIKKNNLSEIEKANEQEINSVDRFGKTPLHIAVEENNLKAVEVLLSMGAKVNAIDIYDTSELQAAAEKNACLEIFEVLLNANADLLHLDNYNKNVLHYAAEHCDKPEVIKALIERGAKVDAVDMEGRTPLHTAGYNENKSAAIVLHKNGASSTAIDKNGNTPFEITFNQETIPEYKDHIASQRVLSKFLGSTKKDNLSLKALEIVRKHHFGNKLPSPIEDASEPKPVNDSKLKLDKMVVTQNPKVKKRQQKNTILQAKPTNLEKYRYKQTQGNTSPPKPAQKKGNLFRFFRR